MPVESPFRTVSFTQCHRCADNSDLRSNQTKAAEGARSQQADQVEFDRRLRVEFRGSQFSSDGCHLIMHELDDPLGNSDLSTAALREMLSR